MTHEQRVKQLAEKMAKAMHPLLWSMESKKKIQSDIASTNTLKQHQNEKIDSFKVAATIAVSEMAEAVRAALIYTNSLGATIIDNYLLTTGLMPENKEKL